MSSKIIRKKTIKPSKEKYDQTIKLMKDLRWLKAQSPIYKDVSVHDLYPDPKPLILVGKNDQFDIIGQDVEVNIEKNMIKDETNIPASILNKAEKIKNSIKEIFHKKPPLAISVTKPAGLENRTMTAPGGIGIIIIIVVIYLLIRGR